MPTSSGAAAANTGKPPKLPRPPAGTKAPGKRLWKAVLEEFELDEHELAMLREAVRTVDMLEDLAGIVKKEGAMVDTPQGRKIHPALVETRQLRIALARLLAALRLPAGDEEENRPQRRVGVRGVYNGLKLAR